MELPCEDYHYPTQTLEVQDFRRRKANWSQEETHLLLKLVQENKGVVKGKFSPNLGTRHKRAAWAYITDTINEAHGNNRKVPEVEKRWQNVRTKALKEKYEYKNASHLGEPHCHSMESFFTLISFTGNLQLVKPQSKAVSLATNPSPTPATFGENGVLGWGSLNRPNFAIPKSLRPHFAKLKKS